MPSELGFVDLDLDATQLGGNVTWREQAKGQTGRAKRASQGEKLKLTQKGDISYGETSHFVRPFSSWFMMLNRGLQRN